jgi:hypothetical protein
MGMNSTVSVAVFHDGVEESAGCLVQVPSLNDELRERVLVLLEEKLSEARCALFGLWVLEPDFIERFDERLSRPDFNVTPRNLLNLFHDLPFPLDKTVPSLLNPVLIDPDPSPSHLDQTWKQIKLKVSNPPEIFFAKLNAKVIPKFESEFGISLTVSTDVHGGEFPHLSFRINAETSSGLD